MDTTHKTNWKQTVILSLLVTLAAQINLDVLTSDFRVSLGILVFPVSIFLSGEISLLPITLLSGAGVYLSRIILSIGNVDALANACLGHFPEIIFYLSYGILSYIYFRRHNYEFQNGRDYLYLFCIDYAANCTELFFRLGTGAIDAKLQISILLVAVIRTLLLLAVITQLGRYKLVIIRKEHADRYQRLVLLISKLNDEVIWMKKNTALIEDTMQRSYQLFSQIQGENVDAALSQSALAVAKDIHEVKKEYMLILRGISEALDLNLQDDGMSFLDMMTLLESSTAALAQEKGIRLEMHTRCADTVFTDKHYFLLSIFRNLLTNALEACEDGHCVLTFTEDCENGDYCFTVTDNGPGIPPENLEDIFSPGFSTKINFDTGEINRGLGLNLVKDVIENQLSGSISVASRPGRTTFTIQIPTHELEVG